MNQPGEPISNSQRQIFLVICVCFLLSGFAALLYETVWLRQFAIILGTSEQALAVILGAYMGGLSFGAWIASRTATRIRRPLLTYGILEAGIAVCALGMPIGLSMVQWLQVKLFGGSPEPMSAGNLMMLMFGLVSAFALILPPTAMMGATLPLLAKYVVRNDEELGPRIGFLYAINTLGAVGGTLCAAFVCLPTLGLGRTTWVGAAANLAVFLLIWFGLSEEPIAQEPALEPIPKDLATGQTEDSVMTKKKSPSKKERKSKRKRKVQAEVFEAPATDKPAPYELILWFAAISGAISFCYEIIFTRMLGHMLGGSIFAFATMLAGFLLGIMLGGAIAARLATTRWAATIYFVYAQALTGIFAIMAFWSINSVSAWSLKDYGGSHSPFVQVAIAIAILLPSATSIGATFPLAIRIFAKDERDALTGSAKVYFANTLGAIAGSLLTGMFLLPYLAYHGSTTLAVTLNAVIAVGLVVVMKVPRMHAAAVIATMICLAIGLPRAPENVLRVTALPGPMMDGDMVFNEVGRSATVTVFDQRGDFRFQTNGLPEAAVQPLGAGMPFSNDAAWLSALPPLLRPDSQSMLIIGLGGGSAASYVPPSIDEVDVFELEPAVVEANRAISQQRRLDPLADPRIKIVLNDGRNGLRLTNKKYDCIVSQPSHPWTAGASHLYTREFDEIAKEHLQPGGVFLQWMDMDFIDEPLMQSMAAGLFDVFKHVRVYEPSPGTLLFVSSDDPIAPENVVSPELTIADEDREFYAEFGLVKPTDLLALLKIDGLALRRFSEGATPITDEFNSLAMRAPYIMANSADDQSELQLHESLSRWEPLEFYKQGLDELCPTIDYRALAIRMRARSTKESSRIDAVLTDPVEKGLLKWSLAQFRGNTTAAYAELKRIAKQFPDDPRPAYLILANGELGAVPKVDEATAAKLLKQLDGRYSTLLGAVQNLIKDDDSILESRKDDELLASFKPDEIGYAHASRIRIVWRVRWKGSEQRLGEEALKICREAAPSLGVENNAYYQTIAAVRAKRPHVALSTALSFAKSLAKRSGQVKTGAASQQQIQMLLPLLARCRQVLADQSAFRSVPPERYRTVTVYIDSLLMNM